MFSLGRKLDDDLLEEVETILIQADFGPTLALDLCDDLRESYSDREFSPEEAIPFLKGKLREKLGEGRVAKHKAKMNFVKRDLEDFMQKQGYSRTRQLLHSSFVIEDFERYKKVALLGSQFSSPDNHRVRP